MHNRHGQLNWLILFLVFLFVSACGRETPAPTAGSITLDEQSKIAATRELTFEDALTASIKVLEVEVQFDNQTPYIKLNMRLTVTNNSKNGLTIRSPELFGFVNYGWCSDDLVHSIFRGNGELIEKPLALVNCHPRIPESNDDFVTLEHGQLSSFDYQLILPNWLFAENRNLDRGLPPGTYFISAIYGNPWIGYAAQTDSFEYIFTDINAWVGKVSSDRVSFVVPPYDLPAETATVAP